MFNDNMNVEGRVNIVLRNAQGEVKDQREVKNRVVDTGLAFFASRAVGTSESIMSHMELGTGTTTAAAGDTALESAVSGARVTFDSDTQTDEQIVFVATFDGSTGNDAITECGIFNAASAGTMLCRTTFPVINKQSGDILQMTWTVSLAAV